MPEQLALAQTGICQECGCSLCPLPIPHTKRACQKCGQATYVCERGEKGGITVRPGDVFTLPAGSIQISLDPNRSGFLTRHGVPWFVSLLFSNGEVADPAEIGTTFDKYVAEAEQVFKSSELLKPFNLSDENQRAEARKVLEQNRETPEWWAALGLAFTEGARRAVEANDAAKTAWLMSKLATCRAMVLFHTTLEKHVWHGYTAAQLRKLLTLWKANEENDDEEFWQQTMSAHALILSQLFSFPAVVLKGKAYVGGKGIENTGAKLLDFLLVNHLTNNTALVEIKKPTTPLLGREYRDGVFPPSSELTGAVTQVLLYKDSLTKDYHTLGRHSLPGFSAFEPPCMVIAGHFRRAITTHERHASFDLFRHALNGVQVVTFDEVFEKIEGLLKVLGL